VRQWFKISSMPAMNGPQRRHRAARRCGRPTQKGTPCRLPQEHGRGCRHHVTRADKEAAAAETRARIERMKQKADLDLRMIRCGAVLVALTVLAGLGCSMWDSLEERRSAAACESHRTRASTLNEQSRAVQIPLVPFTDPSISTLQLGTALPEELEGFNVTSVSEPDVFTAYEQKRSIAGRAARVVLDHRDCFSDQFVSDAWRIERTPLKVSRVVMPSAAHCRDGWPSGSIGQPGACSHHGGVVPARPWATLHFD
jgi:hypothetical protein